MNTYRLQQHLIRALFAVGIAFTLLGLSGILNEAKGQSGIPYQDQFQVVSMYKIESHGNGTYSEISAYPDWKTKWPFYYERYRFLGWTDAQISRATPWCASMNDLAWGTSPNGVRTANNSYATIFIGHGQWASNMSVDWVYGRIIGAGISNVYPIPAYPRGACGTEVLMFPDKWIADATCKVNLPELGTQDNIVYSAFRSVTFNSEGTVGAYHERAGLDQIHINGQTKTFTPGRLVVGFVAWDLGTGSSLGNIYGNAVDVLMLATRGTPGQLHKLSGMGGGVALVLLLGTVDAPYDFESIECDDFPTVFMTREQWGRESGGRIEWDVIKIETGVTSESRNPWTGTIIGDLKGRNIIDGGIVNFAEASVNVGDLFVVNDQHSNGAQPNLIMFTLGKWNVEANLIHETGGNVYPSPTGFPWDAQEVFYYRFANTRKMQVNRTDVAPLAGVVGWKSRLGYQRYNNGWTPPFSHATGSPVFSYQNAGGGSTPPPTTPTCTYTYSAWSACTNGTQTRTVTSATPSGCTGTPVLSQSCTTTPPPTSGAVLTRANVSVTNTKYRSAVSPSVSVKRTVFTNFKMTAAPNWSVVAVPATLDHTHFIFGPDGKVYVGGGVCAVVATTSTGATTSTLVVGTTYPKLEVTFPTSLLVAALGTYTDQGTPALLYTASKLEMFGQ